MDTRDIDPFSEIDDSDAQYIDKNDMMVIEDDFTGNNEVVAKDLSGAVPKSDEADDWQHVRPWDGVDTMVTTYTMKDKSTDKNSDENESESKTHDDPGEDFESDGFKFHQVAGGTGPKYVHKRRFCRFYKSMFP